MSTNTNYITSPKGEIQFLALNRKVSKDLKADSVQGYAVRVKYDSSTKEGKDFKSAIESINPNLIGTKHVNNKNEFTIRAFSQFMPEVLDGKGNNMEELPNFYNDSTGVATLVVTPYMGNAMGGTINLAGVVIHEIDVGEHTSTGDTNREDVLSQLRNALKG